MIKNFLKTLPLFSAVFFLSFALTPNLEAQAGEVNIQVLAQGSGSKTSSNGNRLVVHYEGRLENGEKFDSSRDRGEPFSFVLGQGQVIQGWEIGMSGMKIGEKRRLTIPPDLGYGSRGAGDVIPPNATLIFDVEMIDITEPVLLNNLSNEEFKKAENDGAVVIDIRLEEEWEETGILEGANTITAFTKRGQIHPEFLEKFQAVAPDKNTPIALYCRTGNRTTMLGNALIDQLGYTHVSHLKDGIVGWKKDNHPVTSYMK